MADITLAEYDAKMWLVGGENHLGALLANTLPEGTGIAIVPCATRAELQLVWEQHAEAARENAAALRVAVPWQIHPAIIARVRHSSTAFVVRFADWSVQLGTDARRVVAAAATALLLDLDADVTVVAYEEPGAAAIADLRLQIVVDRLISADVAAGRIRHFRRDAASAGEGPASDRVDILVR